ncbi:MAG TPA: class I SAM-dependent methyltransferase, partial [Candidatus Dormibacteraeota bacterium]|nr:class I SAM-dependent methyltransferase [Candidatus Dormibacteraeota bacterium]
QYGCRVTTTTISQRQYEHCVRLVADAGLTDLVTVLSQDYRDLSGQFSHLVSIEMIEAVDWRDVEGFFATCAHLLSPGGRMALQCIVIADREHERAKTGMDYIQRYIFPGGSLPSITSLATAVTRSGDLRLTDVEDIGFHYARTLHQWRQNLHARTEDARRLGLDEQFLRMWDFYFAYCEAGFLERRISTVQVVLAAPGWRSEPSVRAV